MPPRLTDGFPEAEPFWRWEINPKAAILLASYPVFSAFPSLCRKVCCQGASASMWNSIFQKSIEIYSL